MNGVYIDKTNNYVFLLDYTSAFVPFCKARTFVKEAIERDFTLNLTRFLEHNKLAKRDRAYCIAQSLFAVMSDTNRAYHSPSLPLLKFFFATKEQIRLEPWEQLAIWFANAIVEPTDTNGSNYVQSAAFMRAVLPFGFKLNENQIINNADRGIMALAQDHKCDDIYKFIFDLNLIQYALPSEFSFIASSCHKEEFSKELKLDHYKFMMRQRLTALLSRQPLFKSISFQTKHQEIAKSNLDSHLIMVS